MARVKQAKKLLDKGMSAASKKIDELLTPSELTKAQAAARRRTGRKIAKEKDPLKAFADSKDPAARRLRAEKAAEAKARASKTRAGQRRRQAAARKEAVDKRKSQIAKGAGATAGATTLVGAGAAATTGAKSSNKSAGTRSQTEGKKSTIKKERIGSGRNMYMLDGRLNISKDNLKDSGMTLTEYANYMKKNKKRPPKAQKKMGGGMMKSKMASKGGAKGGRMPTGMKKGGPAGDFPDLSGDGKVTQKDILIGKGVVRSPKKPAKPIGGGRSRDAIKKARAAKIDEMMDRLKASKMSRAKMKSKGGTIKKPGGMKNGGMAKKGPKGYAKGGAMTKKGMAKGGSVHRNTKPRGVGVALRGYGKAMK